MATSTPYELWQRSTLLGVMRARDPHPEANYFRQFFTRQFRSNTEWIDFEKLPIRSKKLAPYVLPKGRGQGVYDDSQRAYRFKPANIVVEESVDDDRGLTFEAGIDNSMLHQELNIDDPMVRRALLKAEMTAQAMLAIERRWEHQRARGIIDGKLTLQYLSGEEFLIDFQRAAGHTEVLTSGNRFGDTGVSILDKFKQIMDTMNDAEFGGTPTRFTMGGGVASIVSKDKEILDQMDINIKGGVHMVERGLAPSGKVYKFGELSVFGNSGQKIELWVNNETYTGPGNTQVRFLGNNEVVATSTPEAIMGVECFGRIQDLDARFQAIPIFPKNFVTGERVKTEQLSFESAPLMVPINPNATYKLTAIA